MCDTNCLCARDDDDDEAEGGTLVDGLADGNVKAGAVTDLVASDTSAMNSNGCCKSLSVCCQLCIRFAL